MKYLVASEAFCGARLFEAERCEVHEGSLLFTTDKNELLACFPAGQWLYVHADDGKQAQRIEGGGNGVTQHDPGFFARCAALANAPTAARPSGWQPIETAPKDGRNLLLWGFPGTEVQIGCWLDRQTISHGQVIHTIQKWTAAGLFALNDGQPTHWMSLPDPP